MKTKYKNHTIEVKRAKGKSYSYYINLYAVMYIQEFCSNVLSTDMLLPAPCLLQLCHNCWQSCLHHPDLQIGEFHVWVFLNYALFPFFYTVQSTHPCFQWEHHHPVQNKKTPTYYSRTKSRVHLVCFKISDSIKLWNSCRLLFRTKLQCTVTLGHNGHHAPLYKFPLYFVQCLYWYMKYLCVKKINKQNVN